MADMNIPLAERVRPVKLEDLIGQEPLVGPGRVLEQMRKSGQARSMIFWGQPGVGKTTLAQIIASSLNMLFFTLSRAAKLYCVMSRDEELSLINLN
jgi:putative ATPase